MKKLIYLFILGSLISCHSHYEYRDRALSVRRQLENSACKDDFWNFEVLNRGSKKFVFIDNSCRVITSFSGSDFLVDTVINERNDFLLFTALKEMEVDQMSRIAYCLKELDVQKIRGFDTDSMKYLECIVNEHLTLYFIPDLSFISAIKRDWFISKTNKIDRNYFYYITK